MSVLWRNRECLTNVKDAGDRGEQSVHNNITIELYGERHMLSNNNMHSYLSVQSKELYNIMPNEC
jgi:hypothetical protein